MRRKVRGRGSSPARVHLLDEVLRVGAHDDLDGIADDDDVEGAGLAQLRLIDEVGVGRVEATMYIFTAISIAAGIAMGFTPAARIRGASATDVS